MTELAEVAANPRIMPLGTSAAFAAGDGADFTIYRYRRYARHMRVLPIPALHGAPELLSAGAAQIIAAPMLCAACLAESFVECRYRPARVFMGQNTHSNAHGITRTR